MIKLDMEKTYDRMEWAFVEENLRDASLPKKMISVIMKLIKKSSCRLFWNGEATDIIRPSRGLRQGDPLSPYIFVLCLQRLSQWIKGKVEQGVWRPLKASRGRGDRDLPLILRG